MDGFNKSDHEQILACLTEDIEWIIPGWAHIKGKAAFDQEIENEAFVGRPVIMIKRLVEEGDVVVAEGTVQAEKRAGGIVNLLFCDVFVMEHANIKQLTSYLTEITSQLEERKTP